jgi:small multidrug resistance family-3 protein
MTLARTVGLFSLTAVCEILGCYLVYLPLRHNRSYWLFVPAMASLAAFAWLLTLHPFAAGRTYAAYGGVYVSVAVIWLALVDQQRPDVWDIAGASITLIGMAVIYFGPHKSA